MGFEGTFSENKRPVITTAPDCLVYLNGELTLPSGGNPDRRVNIQPLITNVSVDLGINQTPGNASISLQIPEHYIDDFFRGGQLILTTMMEVRIYMKGHFKVGGEPRYYPVFWGVTTSVNHSWSGGETTVEMSCQDILYWWTIQRINFNPSYMGKDKANQGEINLQGGGYFTGNNPYDIMYSLARYAFGDAMNANEYQTNQLLTEPGPGEESQLMAYWTRKWGRMSHALKMYGPRGDVIQGGALAEVLSDKNRQAAFQGKEGQAFRQQSKNYDPFDFADVDFSTISPFSRKLSQMGSIDLHQSEFQTKKEIADTTKDAIGYEFFMDVTGELVFKPPFYNLDVKPNKPISWIRPVDIINENYAENPPDVTFLEGTGNLVQNTEAGFDKQVKPKATYVDYRLVQKFGWRPGSYNSEFIGSGSPRNVFYHLVDQLDRENAQVHSGSLSIPIRPELRLGYPVFVQPKDAYYYVESISHQFSYDSQCTTNLNIMARRTKFYGSFPYWGDQGDDSRQQQDQSSLSDQSTPSPDNQPPEGQEADPGTYLNNIYNRPVDPTTGNPVGDRNVILASANRSDQEKKERGEDVQTFEEQETDDTNAEAVSKDIVSFRTQFSITADNDFVYKIDPARGEEGQRTTNNQRQGAITSLALEGTTRVVNGDERTVKVPVFPVSDEQGYEVIGAYEYGRTVQLTRDGFDFSRQGSQRTRQLLNISPDKPLGEGGSEHIKDDHRQGGASNRSQTARDQVTKVDPNNYGRRLLEVHPIGPEHANNVSTARNFAKGKSFGNQNKRGDVEFSGENQGPNGRTFTYTSQVDQWQDEIDQARQELGVSEDQYPDHVIKSFIHVESNGKTNAHRSDSQFYGLLQIGESNAKDLGRENTSFQGSGPNDSRAAKRSIKHFIQWGEKYKGLHGYNPSKMAIGWKGGTGTLQNYNRREEREASGSELKSFLESGTLDSGHSVPPGTADYVERHQAAERTWRGVEQEVDRSERPDPSEQQEEPENVGRDPRDADPDQANRASVKMFEQALEENRQDDIDALPSDVNPIKDTGLISHINDFLKEIYQEGFQQEKELEKELRGETQQKTRPPDLESVPNANPPEDDDLVDTPLSRDEVQQALKEGKSPSEVFGYEGKWEQFKQETQKLSDQASEFEDAGDSLDELDADDFVPIGSDDEE